MKTHTQDIQVINTKEEEIIWQNVFVVERKAQIFNIMMGDMMELVRYQRKNEKQKAAGAEKDIISATEMLCYEKKNYTELGKYVNSINHHLPGDTKKYAWFRSHIWNL